MKYIGIQKLMREKVQYPTIFKRLFHGQNITNARITTRA